MIGLMSPPEVGTNFMLTLIDMGVPAIALVPICRTCGQNISRFEAALLLGSYAVFLTISALLATR